MSERKPSCALITVLLLALLALGYWLSQRSAVHPASTAAPAIASFAGEPELMVKELRQIDSPIGEITQYGTTLQSGEDVLFDVEDGQVVGFFRRGQSSNTMNVSEATAEQSAIRFAIDHNVDPVIIEAPPIIAEVSTSNRSYQHYRFIWTERDPNSGAYLPHALQITVNAETGQVDSYNYVNEPVMVSTEPSVSGQMAAEIVLETVQPILPGAAVTGRMLVVGSVPLFSPAGDQTLLWQIEIEGASSEGGITPAATAFVDAATGEVLQLEPKR